MQKTAAKIINSRSIPIQILENVRIPGLPRTLQDSVHFLFDNLNYLNLNYLHSMYCIVLSILLYAIAL